MISKAVAGPVLTHSTTSGPVLTYSTTSGPSTNSGPVLTLLYH